MSSLLATLLAEQLAETSQSWSAKDSERIDRVLAESFETAASKWQGLAVAKERFVAYVAERLPAKRRALEALERLNLSDLYLCCACADGSADAIALFDRTYSVEVDRALAHLDRSGDLTDEIKQVLRDKLFVAPPGAARKITSYAGRGPLGRWIWVMATREALMVLRKNQRRRETALDAKHLGLADTDLELDYFKREYRAEFQRAFSEAMGGLSSKHRNLLFYHFVRRLTIDQIGAVYRVHRVTAFRWLRAARRALVGDTRRLLAERLKVSSSELESILRLVQSRLEVSVERILTQGQDDRPVA